jgi:hypothetical protein
VFEVLSFEEAEWALYIDFEGPAPSKAELDVELPPVLLGILSEETWEQVIVDKDFYGAADYSSDTYKLSSRARSLPKEHRALVEQCLDEGRVLVGFGDHERDALLTFGDPSLESETMAVYRNAEPTLHAGINGNAPLLKRRSLTYYRKRYGWPEMPEVLDRRKTGPRIADVRKVLIAPRNKGRFGSYATAAKGKWTKVKQRNHRDCWDLRGMVIHAAYLID